MPSLRNRTTSTHSELVATATGPSEPGVAVPHCLVDPIPVGATGLPYVPFGFEDAGLMDGNAVADFRVWTLWFLMAAGSLPLYGMTAKIN